MSELINLISKNIAQVITDLTEQKREQIDLAIRLGIEEWRQDQKLLIKKLKENDGEIDE